MSPKFEKKLLYRLIGAVLLIVLPAVLVPLNAVRADNTHTAWQGGEEAAVRLVSDRNALDERGRVWLGVHIQLKPGWKTYWRNPGESGAPPLLNWQDSKNLSDAEVKWPAPTRFSAFGFDSFGYHDEVVLPVLLRAAAPGKPLAARLDMNYMVCKNVCIPMHANWAMDVPPVNIPPSSRHPLSTPREAATLIRRYLALVPKAAGHSSMTIRRASVGGPAGQQTLVVEAHADQPFHAPDLMVEAPDPFGFGRPDITLGGGGHDVTLRLAVFAGIGGAVLSDQALTLTLVDGHRAVELYLTLGR
ncbi:MAG: protein-disulfide reductase DsbD domain-containing protein [Alphaproteobacteria bacterium]